VDKPKFKRLVVVAVAIFILFMALMIWAVIYITLGIAENKQHIETVANRPVKTMQGPQGPQGPSGLSIIGPVGPQGEKGDTGMQTVVKTETNTVVEKQLPPEKGEKGDPGDPGQPGREIELRLNPQTKLFEYRYVGDTRWTPVEGQDVGI
jgi:hypothetical protein